MKKPKQLLSIVRQYIWAKDSLSAIRQAKKNKAHEVWVDEEFRKTMSNNGPMGFKS